MDFFLISKKNHSGTFSKRMLWWLFGWGWKLWLIIIIIIIIAIWIVYSRCKELIAYFKDRYLASDPKDSSCNGLNDSPHDDTHNDTKQQKSTYKFQWPFQSRDPLARTEDDILDRLENLEVKYYPTKYSNSKPPKKHQQYNAFNETMYMNEGYNRTFDDYLDNQGFEYPVKSDRSENLEPNITKVYITKPGNPSRLRINKINKTTDSINHYNELTNRLNALQRDEMPGEQHSNYQTQSWNKAESTGETICRRVLEDLYQKPYPVSRPDFLRNPETGRNLELDGYCEELGIAFEYQGEQHYKFPNIFHQNEADFISQIRRDKYKAKACELAGVYLIPVPYNIPYQDIRQYIIDRLPNDTTT